MAKRRPAKRLSECKNLFKIKLMIPKPPVFLFAFANDQQKSLALEQEEREIRKLLQDSHDGRKIEYHSLSATSLEDIYQAFNRFHNRIHLFHYGGHSSSRFLELVDRKSRAANLAVLMGMQKNLKIVVLNGCANQAQVQELFDNGVKAVIATRSSIEDQKALRFSTAFYEAMRSGRSIKDAFKHASARVKEDDPALEIVFRDEVALSASGSAFPWGLYAQNDANMDWKFPNPFEIPEGLDFFTEVELTRPDINKKFIELVFEGMAKLNRKCRFLWEDYQDTDSNDTNLYDLQEAIYNHFPSILGVQIRDLFTEDAKRSGRLRLTELNEIYLVLGKFLCAMALASLWQAIVEKKASDSDVEDDFYIRPAYKKDLKAYLSLKDQENNQYDYIWLLSAIDRIFYDNEAEPFINELSGVNRALSENSELYDAYQFLEFELKKRLQLNNIASREVADLCSAAEEHLGIIIKHFAFLITYQLISVNDISVQNWLWGDEVNFVHNKVLLKGVEETIRDRDPLARRKYTCNHSVVVTKNFKSEESPLTLLPFVIDENAYKLKVRGQSKIHFFAGRTEKGKLWYQHTEVLSGGFELLPEQRNIYRIDDLDRVVSLFNLFIEHLKLDM
jgi:hypothetical protein